MKTKHIKRIQKILKLIEKIWKKNPDLRLCQLLYNAIDNGDDFDLFYVEDDKVEKDLQKFYKEDLGDK